MRAPHEGDRLAATAAPPARTALPWSLLLVLAVALLLRLGFDAARSRPPVSDQADYDRIAWTLATHGTYQDDGRPTAFRLPGYVAFIGAIYRVVGRHPGAVYAVQAALDAGTALLLFVLLRRRSARAAWIGAILWALLPSAIAYSGLLLSETLFAFLLVVLAAKLDRGKSRSALDRFATGLLLGALILVKTPALLLLAALLLAAVATGAGRRSIPLVAGALLLAAPWFARNVVVLRVPALTTSLGSNLLIGNNPNADGGYLASVPPSMLPRDGDEVAQNAQSIRSALAYVRAYPARMVTWVPLRWAHLVMGEAELAVTSFAPDPVDPATSFRQKVRALPPALVVALWAPSAVVLAAGLLGFLAWPGGAIGTLFASVLAAWLVTHGVTFGGSRHHFAWMPFLVFYASRFFAAPRATWASLRPGRRALAIALIAPCVAVWAGECVVYWARR